MPSKKQPQLPKTGKAKEYSFFQDVYDVVRQIPKGRVTSYGAIAAYLGTKLSARMVGWAMNGAHNVKPKVPAQRVVNRNGMLTTGKMINGAEAYRIGLVNQLGHNETLVDTAIEIIESIAAKAPLAIGYVVDSINAVFEEGVDGYQTEIDGFAACTLTSDFKEGASAFLEKRKANFQGK